MFKIILISLCFIALAVASSVNHIDDENLKVDFVTIENIEEYKKNNPSIELIPLKSEVTPFEVTPYKYKVTHTHGKRVAGDKLLATGKGGETWPTARNAKLQLRYPDKGVGANITFFQVDVSQSSNTGRAYIIAGGIGQKYINVIVEADNTTHMNYETAFYGY